VGPARQELKELASVFLKLGAIGFGGPAAHLGMMEDEVVRKRNWLSRDEFLSMVGVTNLIPGPNSTEMAIHVGYLRAGWFGLIVAGSCFILPAVIITALFAGIYVEYGSLPAVVPFLRGIQPAVLAIIVSAMVRFGKTAFKSWKLTAVALLVLAASLAGFNEVLALLGGGIAGAAWILLTEQPSPDLRKDASFTPWVGPAFSLPALGGAGVVSFSSLGLIFLKVGAVLYGSGYVLIAFLQGELVERRGWLTQHQLLDAIAVGQFTPGPVLSTATFVGYQILGLPGALAATAGIFLPAFIYVAFLSPFLPMLRSWKPMPAFLEAVTASSVSLIAAVSLKLFVSTMTGWGAGLIFLAALICTVRWNVTPFWIVLGGAAAGWLAG
jgi:chromate transporter